MKFKNKLVTFGNLGYNTDSYWYLNDVSCLSLGREKRC
ncbi:hypothetical protein SBA3_1040027 [Candidatus Sulfopaludibacter sp. SbA3]|nr:hypothetical protein SBA3_1040027 [Candidatus Sulfopaludibacter sp. SbA3]